MDTELFASLSRPDDRLAVAVDGAALTYRELARAAAAHLARLADEGVREGDRVAVWAQPSLSTVVALVAHAAGGLVSVPLNPKAGTRELAHVLEDARPVRVLAADRIAVREATPEAFEIRVEIAGPATLPPAPVDAHPLLVLYTSGTTGPPKGAVLSRRNVAFDLEGLASAWGWTREDTVLHALPLFHVHGLVLGLFGPLARGGAMRWLPRFDPEALARALDPRAVLFGVPTMYHRLSEVAEANAEVARALGAARLLVSGSAGLPVREHRRIEAATGRGVLERYGLTETLIDCAVRAEDGPRPGTVGPPLSGVALRLVDEARAPIDAHDDATLGEVAVRGDNVFCGYLNRPEATAAVIDEAGWFYTGDLATRASDGAIRIVGRRGTDLVKTGGYKVGAGEVEAALLEADGVAEAAVIGAPDEDLGERIVAFVVRRPGAEVSAEALMERVASDLAPHKRPREVHFVAALPRNAMGKVVKARLILERG